MSPTRLVTLAAFLFALVVALAAGAAGNALVGVVVRERALHDVAARLSRAARELKRRIDANRELGLQMEFLHQLPSLLPEQTRFVRGQTVMQEELVGLRRKVASRLGKSVYILVDTKLNKLYLKRGMKVLVEADCSVGVGGRLKDPKTGRVWDFTTPRGVFNVLWKTEDPVWIKPDWAFVESKQPVPPPDDPSRMVKGELGRFLLSIGNGYLIHGTPHEDKLGRPASHGCIRLGASALEEVYKLAPMGTRVYVY